MATDEPSSYSEEVKAAILSEASQWAVEKSREVEKTRRNFMIAVLFASFFGITGLLPSKIAALGIEIAELPRLSVFLFMSLLVIYMYWSYENARMVSAYARKMANRAYNEVIGYDSSRTIAEEETRLNVFISQFWQRYMPFLLCISSVVICLLRMFLEYRYGSNIDRAFYGAS